MNGTALACQAHPDASPGRQLHQNRASFPWQFRLQPTSLLRRPGTPASRSGRPTPPLTGTPTTRSLQAPDRTGSARLHAPSGALGAAPAPRRSAPRRRKGPARRRTGHGANWRRTFRG